MVARKKVVRRKVAVTTAVTESLEDAPIFGAGKKKKARKKKEWRKPNEVLGQMIESRSSLTVVYEYVFHPTRKWRIDIAFPDIKLAIEIDGSAHLRHKQRNIDCEKMNSLIERGWRVLRYPASSVLTLKRCPWIADQIIRVVLGVAPQPGEDERILTT